MSCDILIITNKGDITTDFVVKALRNNNKDFFRFNTEDLWSVFIFSYEIGINNTVTATLQNKITGEEIDLQKVKSVYFRRPELPSYKFENISCDEKIFLARENSRVLEGIYKILDSAFWISNVWNIREAENKIWQLQLAKEIGFKIPNSHISGSLENIHKFYQKNQNLIAKTLAGGLVVDNNATSSVIFTSKIDRLPFEDELSGSFLFMQEEIQKSHDVRVIMVGNKCFAVKIDSQINLSAKTDWRRSYEVLTHTPFYFPEIEQEKCRKLLSKLGLNFGAFDFIITPQGDIVFLEINPNGQWAWIENLAKLPISDEIAKLLENHR